MNSYDFLFNDSNDSVKNIIITDENISYNKNDNYNIKKMPNQFMIIIIYVTIVIIHLRAKVIIIDI